MQKVVLVFIALLASGCATVPSGKPDPRDPWERFNRSSFAFNDALDKAVAKPVAKAYKKVTPRVVRTGVSNFVGNLGTVTTIVNDVLQGKIKQAGHDSARFLMNTTLGLGGLFDPATAAGLENNDEDFGQTLGKWGVKSGPYLMLPILGPSTVRDTLGRLPDQYTYPVNYLEDDSTRYLIRAVDFLDLRAGLLDLDAQLERSYDRYAFVRNAWLQRREFQVTDGNVEDQSLELEQGIDTVPEAAPDAATPAPQTPDEPPKEDAPRPDAGAAAPASPPGG
jgi:phospholipid-binding lipoprotein MlaA